MNGVFHGIDKTCVIKAYNISVYGIDFSSDLANKAMTKIKIKTLDQKARPDPRIVVGSIGEGCTYCAAGRRVQVQLEVVMAKIRSHD